MGIIPSATGRRGSADAFARLVHGKVPTNELGSGTADSTTFLRGDQTYAVPQVSTTKVDLTAQTANIATANIIASPSAGVYDVEVYLMATTSDVAAGTLDVTIGWTDNVGSTTSTPITAFPLTATGRTSGRQVLRAAGGNITYAVTVTGIYATAQYAIYVRVTSLG